MQWYTCSRVWHTSRRRANKDIISLLWFAIGIAIERSVLRVRGREHPTPVALLNLTTNYRSARLHTQVADERHLKMSEGYRLISAWCMRCVVGVGRRASTRAFHERMRRDSSLSDLKFHSLQRCVTVNWICIKHHSDDNGDWYNWKSVLDPISSGKKTELLRKSVLRNNIV